MPSTGSEGAVLTCQLVRPDETLWWVVEELIAHFLDKMHIRGGSFKLDLSPHRVTWFLTQGLGTEFQIKPLMEDISRRQGVTEVVVQLGVTLKLTLRPVSGSHAETTPCYLDPAYVPHISKAVTVNDTCWTVLGSRSRGDRLFVAPRGTTGLTEELSVDTNGDGVSATLSASAWGGSVEMHATQYPSVTVSMSAETMIAKGNVHDFGGVFLVTFALGLLRDRHEVVLSYKFSKMPWWRRLLWGL